MIKYIYRKTTGPVIKRHKVKIGRKSYYVGQSIPSGQVTLMDCNGQKQFHDNIEVKRYNKGVSK